MVYVGYGIAKKLDSKMLVHWKRLLFIYLILAFAILAIQISFLVSSSTAIEYTFKLEGGYSIIFTILLILLTIYSFATIWGTYKHLRESVYKK